MRKKIQNVFNEFDKKLLIGTIQELVFLREVSVFMGLSKAEQRRIRNLIYDLLKIAKRKKFLANNVIERIKERVERQ